MTDISSTKHIYFIRHGEGYHNAALDWSIFDAHLTEKGIGQATAVQPPEGLQLIISSPMTRAIQTTFHIWQHKYPCSVRISHLHSERWSYQCDEGRPKSALLQDFPFLSAWEGWNELPEEWTPTQ